MMYMLASLSTVKSVNENLFLKKVYVKSNSNNTTWLNKITRILITFNFFLLSVEILLIWGNSSLNSIKQIA